MDTFLSDLELKIQQQSESIKTTQAPALNVSCTQPSNSSWNKNQKQRTFCKNGSHNPNTSHSTNKFHQIHPKLAIAHHQAALSQITNKIQPGKENLSHCETSPNLVILESGASAHYLKHRE